MKIKEIIIRFCIWVMVTFMSLVVPFTCFVVPCLAAITDSLWYLLFYIVTLPLAFVWYAFMPKMWEDIKEDLIAELITCFGNSTEGKR